MRPAFAAVLMLAGVSACSGYTPGTTGLSDAGSFIGGGTSDAGDAGQGDGGDAGQDAGLDAGCAALSLNTTGIIDTCPGGSMLAATGSVSVNTASCTAVVNTTFRVCNGTVTGASDAFDGNCGGYVCSGSSLPGTIVCPTGPNTSCTIRVCDGGC